MRLYKCRITNLLRGQHSSGVQSFFFICFFFSSCSTLNSAVRHLLCKAFYVETRSSAASVKSKSTVPGKRQLQTPRSAVYESSWPTRTFVRLDQSHGLSMKLRFSLSIATVANLRTELRSQETPVSLRLSGPRRHLLNNNQTRSVSSLMTIHNGHDLFFPQQVPCERRRLLFVNCKWMRKQATVQRLSWDGADTC